MKVVLLGIGVAVLLASLFAVFVSIFALRSWRERPAFLIAAMFGWLAVAALLVFATRTDIPFALEVIMEPSDESAASTDTTMTTTETVATNIDDDTYRSLVPIRAGRIDHESYERLGSARRSLLKMRLTEAAGAGDQVAHQALQDIEHWEKNRAR